MADEPVDGYINRNDGSRAMVRCDGYLYEIDPPSEPAFKLTPEEVESMCRYMAGCQDPDDKCDAYSNKLVRDGWTHTAIAMEVEKYLK